MATRSPSVSPTQTRRKAISPTTNGIVISSSLSSSQLSPSSSFSNSSTPLRISHPDSLPSSPSSSGKFKPVVQSQQTTPRSSTTNNSGQMTKRSVSPFGIMLPSLGSSAKKNSSKLLGKRSIEVDEDTVSSVRLKMRNKVFQETKVYQDILSHERKNQTKRISTILDSLSQFTGSPNKVQLGKKVVFLPEATGTAFSPKDMFNTEFSADYSYLSESVKSNLSRKKLLEKKKITVIEKTPYRRQESLFQIGSSLLRRTKSDESSVVSKFSTNTNNTNRPRATSPSSWGTAMRWGTGAISSRLEELAKPKNRVILPNPNTSSPSPRQRLNNISNNQPSNNNNSFSENSSVSRMGSAFDRLFRRSESNSRNSSSPFTIPNNQSSVPNSSRPSLVRVSSTNSYSSMGNGGNYISGGRRGSNSSMRSM